ncbi:DUF3107 domain-containing protein [Dermacoccaceae bacterium W4C1]
MEVKIGVRNVAREVVVDTVDSAEEVSRKVTEAMTGKEPLVLTDERGQKVIVPGEAIGYVDIAAEVRGRVGFGS